MQEYKPRHSPPSDRKREEQKGVRESEEQKSVEHQQKRRRVSGKAPEQKTETPPRASSSSVVTYDDIAKAFGVPQAIPVAPSTPTAKAVVAVEESPIAVEESPAVDNPVVQEYTDVGHDAVIRVYKDTHFLALKFFPESPRIFPEFFPE